METDQVNSKQEDFLQSINESYKTPRQGKIQVSRERKNEDSAGPETKWSSWLKSSIATD